MAFNAFTEVVLDERRNVLIVKGTSNPPQGADAKIFAAVISVDDPDCRRTLPGRVLNPNDDPWEAEVPNALQKNDDAKCAEATPFTAKEGNVFVVGSAKSSTHGFELWVNELPLGTKA